MAKHINSVRDSGIPPVSQDKFYDLMLPGDIVCCWGDPFVSKAIEDVTKGPSHIFKVWLPVSNGPWATFEAEFPKGVRFGKFTDYTRYKGDLVLCRRPLTFLQVEEELKAAVNLLDDGYDLVEFATIVGRTFCGKFPVIQPEKQLFCSAAIQAVSEVSLPFALPTSPWATPEQLFTDPSMTPICALLQQS